MVTEGIWLALIVAMTTAVTTTITPVSMALITARTARRDKLEDYARQDAVAAKAAEAAKLLIAANVRVEASARGTSDKLDAIHSLVNSNMTAAMQAELDATVRELAMMREVIELKRTAGKEPSPESLAAKEMTKTRIAELTAALNDRRTQ